MITDITPQDFDRLLLFAAQAHQGQNVPGSDLPYMLHLCKVATEIMAALQHQTDKNARLAIHCAWLHDTLEDTGTSKEQLEQYFGQQITEGVAALTKNSTLAKPQAMADSLSRIRQQPEEVWMVKLADRIANLGPPPGHWGQEKIKAYAEEAMTIHKALHGASPYLAKRLLARIKAYKGLAVQQEREQER